MFTVTAVVLVENASTMKLALVVASVTLQDQPVVAAGKVSEPVLLAVLVPTVTRKAAVLVAVTVSLEVLKCALITGMVEEEYIRPTTCKVPAARFTVFGPEALPMVTVPELLPAPSVEVVLPELFRMILPPVIVAAPVIDVVPAMIAPPVRTEPVVKSEYRFVHTNPPVHSGVPIHSASALVSVVLAPPVLVKVGA